MTSEIWDRDLDLPEEPSWGLIRRIYDPRYELVYGAVDLNGRRFAGRYPVGNIVDYIPVTLTDEEIERVRTPH